MRGDEYVDLARLLIMVLVCSALSWVDVAKAYHSIRGQAMIKLYVIYNILEICDKMCCYIGPDTLDTLFRTLHALGTADPPAASLAPPPGLACRKATGHCTGPDGR